MSYMNNERTEQILMPLSIESPIFMKARTMFDDALESLIKAMLSKGFFQGNIGLKCTVTLLEKPVIDDDTGELKLTLQPKLTFKVTHGISASASMKDEDLNDKYEIGKDENGRIGFKESDNAQVRIEEAR